MTPVKIQQELTEEAHRRGAAPERLPLERLRANGAAKREPIPGFEPQDEWEQRLLRIGTPCGVSWSNGSGQQ